MGTNEEMLNGMCSRAGKVSLGTWLQELRTVVAANKSLVNDIRSNLQGDGIVSLPALETGSTSPNVANAAFDFQINGIRYSKAAVTAGTALAGDSIPQSTFGAFRLQIGVNGTVDVVEAAGNTTGYASVTLANAGLPALAADHASMGTVSVYHSGGAFTPGTTHLDAANVTESFTDAQTAQQAIAAAVSASLPTSLAT